MCNICSALTLYAGCNDNSTAFTPNFPVSSPYCSSPFKQPSYFHRVTLVYSYVTGVGGVCGVPVPSCEIVTVCAGTAWGDSADHECDTVFRAIDVCIAVFDTWAESRTICPVEAFQTSFLALIIKRRLLGVWCCDFDLDSVLQF